MDQPAAYDHNNVWCSIVIGGNSTDIGTIVIVSPKPGDAATANGTALLNKLAGITADGNNPYVIKLGPGIYDVGADSVQMKEYVDMRGQGRTQRSSQDILTILTQGWFREPTMPRFVSLRSGTLEEEVQQ